MLTWIISLSHLIQVSTNSFAKMWLDHKLIQFLSTYEATGLEICKMYHPPLISQASASGEIVVGIKSPFLPTNRKICFYFCREMGYAFDMACTCICSMKTGRLPCQSLSSSYSKLCNMICWLWVEDHKVGKTDLTRVPQGACSYCQCVKNNCIFHWIIMGVDANILLFIMILLPTFQSNI